MKMLKVISKQNPVKMEGGVSEKDDYRGHPDAAFKQLMASVCDPSLESVILNDLTGTVQL